MGWTTRNREGCLKYSFEACAGKTYPSKNSLRNTAYRRKASAATAENIVKICNDMKWELAGDKNFMDMAGRRLNELGFLGNKLVYTADGLKHKRLAEALPKKPTAELTPEEWLET